MDFVVRTSNILSNISFQPFFVWYYIFKSRNKINLGIGVYKDAQGTTPIMRAVKEAEKRLFDNEKTKNYLTIDGIADYNERTKELLFGKDSEVIKANRARTVQSLGGTGALRIAAEFIKRQTKA